MISFFDTNVLVSAAESSHRHHDRAFRCLEHATRPTAYCGVHTLAEVYATLTRLPVRPPLRPEQCLVFIEELTERLTVVSLTAAEYLTTIRRAADAGLAGGIIYDALLLACARKCGADVIYTFNTDHFTRIAPDLADRIQAPG
jgi:predicted nucleic acid-binding protein